MKSLRFGFRIESIDLEKRTGMLVLTQKQDGVMNKSGKLSVRLSGLLLHNISAGRVEVGKYYESTNESRDYHENPMQLICYALDENTVGYLLSMVFEDKSEKRVEQLPFGGEREYYVHHKRKSYLWRRWRNCLPKGFNPTSESK